MFQKIEEYINSVQEEVGAISTERKEILDQVVEYVRAAPSPKLNFICTHNSRRSHLSQLWAQTMADKFGVTLETFSGGTEATAFNFNAVAALRRAGFEIKNPGGDNLHYEVFHSEESEPMIAYSKRFEDAPNPTKGFAAIMTCSEADAECPIVFGADQRIKLFYEDPKVADGTPEEASRYDERCRQIATEMHYVFGKIKGQE